ncbi:hypothetical protein GCM10023187_50100 [Nibrella viscosa]|uniref:Uncharacterized protein n=1 Tax=Nibrella viscosa TaxID=1084524 RepID=A0ABP8KWE4_9BACT
MEPGIESTIPDNAEDNPPFSQPNVCPVHTDLLVLANIRALQLDLSDRLVGSEND